LYEQQNSSKRLNRHHTNPQNYAYTDKKALWLTAPIATVVIGTTVIATTVIGTVTAIKDTAGFM